MLTVRGFVVMKEICSWFGGDSQRSDDDDDVDRVECTGYAGTTSSVGRFNR